MVAEVSKHDAEFIMKQMPYARGLQFRTIWWQLKKIECEHIGSEQSSLKTIIQ
jgi:hypothetical protein